MRLPISQLCNPRLSKFPFSYYHRLFFFFTNLITKYSYYLYSFKLKLLIFIKYVDIFYAKYLIFVSMIKKIYVAILQYFGKHDSLVIICWRKLDFD